MGRLELFLLAAHLVGCSASRGAPEPRRPPADEPSALALVRDAGPPVGPGACVPEGVALASGEDAGAAMASTRPCCEGLEKVQIYKGSFIRLDECEAVAGPRFFCVRCGNGRCGLGETACNCPADCHL